MRTLSFLTAVAGPLAILAGMPALAQTPARPARPNVAPTQPRENAIGRRPAVPPTPGALPRAADPVQFPMPIVRVDVSRFAMPVAGGDATRYPIRIIRPAGEEIAVETAPPVGVPVPPKLLEPVRLKSAPVRPPVSK